MCGIAGVVSPDPGARDEATIRRMLGAVAHRGPDDRGIGQAGPTVLGAQRLAIIDVAAGRQPMYDESGEIIAVQNGEIYNFEAVRSELEALGHRFRTRSDTEILPHAYEEWGDELATHLRGMFAIAIWDQRRQRLLLARDRFGKKPLLYGPIPGGLVFGSEIPALLAHPSVDRTIDESAIAAYLGLGFVPAPMSAFVGIRKVPPAHTLAFEGGTISVRRYWTLRVGPKLAMGLDEAADELRERIDQAVRLRLISDVPLGAFLSGGLDSSTVVAFMSRHVPRVRTFAVGFADEDLNELPHARAVARAFGTDHVELVVDDQDLDALPMLIRHVGEPYADSSIVPTYQIARCRAATQRRDRSPALVASSPASAPSDPVATSSGAVTSREGAGRRW